MSTTSNATVENAAEEELVSINAKDLAILQRKSNNHGRLLEALRKCKAHCAGDKVPFWEDEWQTTQSRYVIMDIVDFAIDEAEQGKS